MDIKAKTIKKGLGKALANFWGNPFLILLVVLLLYAAIGGVLFYWFYLKPLSEEPKFNFPSIQINQGLLQEFAETWQMRAERFQQSQARSQTDFFKVPIKIPPNPSQ